MTSYRDHKDHGRQVIHSWEVELRQRLAWLYGDPDKRMQYQAADLRSWRQLGQRDAA